MVRTEEDLEQQLERIGRALTKVGPGTYVVRLGPTRPMVAIRLSPPVLVLQVAVGQVPPLDAERSARLYKKLLEFNAVGLVHAAYGLEGETMVLSAAFELESVDPNEIEAALSDMDMALAEQVPQLRELAGGHTGDGSDGS